MPPRRGWGKLYSDPCGGKAAPIASNSGSHVVGLLEYARSEGLGVQLMVSGTARRAMAVAGVLAVSAGGAVIVGAANGDEPSGQSAAVERGLSVKHMTAEGMAVDRNAQAGAANAFEIENNSKTSLTVTVKARPWTQSSSGLVSPNRRRELSSVRAQRCRVHAREGRSEVGHRHAARCDLRLRGARDHRPPGRRRHAQGRRGRLPDRRRRSATTPRLASTASKRVRRR